MASDAQAWKQKPAPFGGQSDVTAALKLIKETPIDYSGITFTLLGYPEAGGIYENLNAHYTITGGAAGSVISGCNQLKENLVVLAVTGISDTNIAQTTLEVGTSSCAF